jgi:hypothetical protein
MKIAVLICSLFLLIKCPRSDVRTNSDSAYLLAPAWTIQLLHPAPSHAMHGGISCVREHLCIIHSPLVRQPAWHQVFQTLRAN